MPPSHNGLSQNDINVIKGVIADELKPIWTKIEMTGDKTVDETRKAIDEIRKSIDENRLIADEARRTADVARITAVETDKVSKTAILKCDTCPAKLKIESLDLKIANKEAFAGGVKWTAGKIWLAAGALITFAITSGILSRFVHFN